MVSYKLGLSERTKQGALDSIEGGGWWRQRQWLFKSRRVSIYLAPSLVKIGHV